MRTRDWADTSLGGRDAWPIPLRTALNLVLNAGLPMSLVWGRDRVIFSNDASRGLGFEASELDAALISKVFERAETISVDERVLRSGGSELSFSLGCSPVHGAAGDVEGVLITLRDTTDERERKKQQVLLRSTLDHFPSVIAFKDSEGRFLDVNKVLERRVGLPREQILGKTEADLVPSAHAEAYRARDQEVMRSRQPQLREEVSQLPSGTLHHIDVSFPLIDENDRVYGVGHISHDITEHKRLEQALRASEKRCQALFERIDEAFCVVQLMFDAQLRPVDYRFLELNPAFEHHAGLSEAIGRTARELIPGLEERWFETYGKVALTGEPTRFEQESKAMGRWFDVFAFRIDHPDDHKVAMIFTDITDRKRAEEALRSSEERARATEETLDAFFQGSPGILNIFDVEDGFRYVNVDSITPSYFGLTRETLIGRRLQDLRPSFIETFGPMMKEVLRTGLPRVDQEVFHPSATHPGETLTWLASYFPVPLAGGRKGVGVMGVDISEMKQAHERLLEADRRKNEFLAVLSHELRNPLAPMRNAVTLLERAPPGGEQSVRARQIIDRQVTQMARLIEDLLDVTRISRGKLVLQRERVVLSELARRTAEDHREVFVWHGVTLEVQTPAEPLVVWGDPVRLSQVVGNLLNNAVKFTPRGGTTVLSLARDGGEALLRVRDDGAGMSAATLSRLFEPFEQAAQTIDRSRGGLGLGLSLVRALVQLHGGQVAAMSEGEGQGAEFIITLPLELTVFEAPAAVPLQPVTQRRRVVLVEDNIDAAETLRELLELEHHEVATAHSGDQGLALVRSYKPDVVLCDLGLPGLDGYAVARAVRTDPELKGTFLVALSGYALPEDVAKAKAAGFDRHLAKPPSLEAIERLLREASSSV